MIRVTAAPVFFLLSLMMIPVCYGQQYWAANGHYYQVVHVPGGITWEDAKAQAESNGSYLATITSVAESLWLTDTFGFDNLEDCWIGAYQPPGSEEPSGGWAWVTGEAWVFTNWFPGEPNNMNEGRENVVSIEHGVMPGSGAAWNDMTSSALLWGYVAEYSVDSDGDGIPDDADACPNQNATGFDADRDGCIDSMPGLIALVKTLATEGVIEAELLASLLVKVADAARSADRERIDAAINQLEALQQAIYAQSGKKISVEAANQVIEYIDSLIAWYRSQAALLRTPRSPIKQTPSPKRDSLKAVSHRDAPITRKP
jgi:hypothetical protein